MVKIKGEVQLLQHQVSQTLLFHLTLYTHMYINKNLKSWGKKKKKYTTGHVEITYIPNMHGKNHGNTLL